MLDTSPVKKPAKCIPSQLPVIPPPTTASDYEVHFRWRLKCSVPTFINLLVVCIFAVVISHNQFEIITLKKQVQLLEDNVQECINEIRNGNRNLHEQQISRKDHMRSRNEFMPTVKKRAKRVAKQGKKLTKKSGRRYRRGRKVKAVNSGFDSNQTLAIHLLNHKTVGEIGRKVEIRDWYASEFIPGGEESFLLDRSGRSIRIKVPGLYWIYSQLYYIDLLTEGGYEICLDWKKDNQSCRSLARCVFTNGRSDEADATCFTGTAARLKASDVIYIRLLQLGRRINFTSGNCFFGLIRIGD
ncbi:uncharacterized protein LOC136036902 [Artemia franciscana]|uniref:uncharacterized protein LOC136036902 n=1 Tax=Artemia franciscana TaxID=6661 RepID=UPI0032DB4189